MKHLPTLLILLFTCSVASAQIPNAGFENWTAPNGYDVPAGWLTLNDFTAQYGMFTCTQGSPGHNSASCMRLTTTPIPDLTTVAGQATSGDDEALIEGFPCALRPEQLNGWWMYGTPLPGPDFGLIAVTFTRWNPDLQQAEEIGAGYVMTPGTMTSWEPFAVPITYISAEFPDTAVISMISSGGLLQPGNMLSVDDLAFDSNTALHERTPGTAWVMRDGLLHLPAAQLGDRVRVLDNLGRELRQVTVSAVPFTWDLSSAPPGFLIMEHRRQGERTVFRAVR